MANLIIQDNGVARTTPAVHGEEITIQAPCDCSDVTGVQIAGVEYPFYDAAGKPLATGTGLFSEGSLIRVLIDAINTRATIINHAITPASIGAAPAWELISNTEVNLSKYNQGVAILPAGFDVSPYEEILFDISGTYTLTTHENEADSGYSVPLVLFSDDAYTYDKLPTIIDPITDDYGDVNVMKIRYRAKGSCSMYPTEHYGIYYKMGVLGLTATEEGLRNPVYIVLGENPRWEDEDMWYCDASVVLTAKVYGKKWTV